MVSNMDRGDFLKKLGAAMGLGALAVTTGEGIKAATPMGIDDLVYEPPMPDKTISTGMYNTPNDDMGWGNVYEVTMDSPNTKPQVEVFNGSSNIDYEARVIPTEDPLKYIVPVIISTYDENSTENITVDFQAIPTSVPEETYQVVPNDFVVDKVYKNMDDFKIDLTLKESSDLFVDVVSLEGKIVHSYRGKSPAGKQSFEWNDDVASGMYLVRVYTPNQQHVEKVMR